MIQVDDLSRSLIAFEQISTLVIVVELSQSSWLAADVVPGIERRALKKLDPIQLHYCIRWMVGGIERQKLARDHTDRCRFRVWSR